MTNFKYYYAKLSCPKSYDDGRFLKLFENLNTNKKFDFNLENIPNNLENANQNDIIFIHIGGDDSNKKKYFKDSNEFIDYTNGLHCIGIIKEIQHYKKEIKVSIIGLKSIVTKEDLYFFPQFINNLGASTKGTPNQAGLYKLKNNIALGLIEYLYKRELLDKENKLFKDLDVSNTLFSTAIEDYNNNFNEKKITQEIFEKYTNKKEENTDNIVVNSFIKWFNSKENIKQSYKGIVNKENLIFWDRSYFNNNLFKITGKNKESSINKIKKLIDDNQNDNWIEFNKSTSRGAPKAVLGDKNYLKFLNSYLNNYNFNQEKNFSDFKIYKFNEACNNSKLKYSSKLISRYISSLITKPFVLLSGLSGSGKTKLAQSFAQWICENEKQYCIVPVGADWTNREPLLGYVNALDTNNYVLPENGALQLIIEANKEENKEKPYFLILDEMNLSHVERYFADFLSVMESKDKFKLHSSEDPLDGGNNIEIKKEYGWPKNLFVVGTVNIDETTYMFSPKVLDRANTIEFRVTEKEISNFLKSPNQIDLTQLKSKGANMAANFIEIAINKEFEEINTDDLNDTLVNFFSQLQKTGAEFGYRTGMEIHRLYQQLTVINKEISENEKIDIAVMQKLLPKLHGSRRKLCPILETLGNICVKDIDVKKDIFENEDFKLYTEVNDELVLTGGVLYPLSLEKITRMYKGAIYNGFASYAEA